MASVSEIVDLFDVAEIRVVKVELKEDVSLTDQGLDSLDMATLLHHVEKKWAVAVPMESLVELRSLKDIADFVNKAAAHQG